LGERLEAAQALYLLLLDEYRIDKAPRSLYFDYGFFIPLCCRAPDQKIPFKLRDAFDCRLLDASEANTYGSGLKQAAVSKC
jgi:hypothetical protein